MIWAGRLPMQKSRLSSSAKKKIVAISIGASIQYYYFGYFVNSG